MKFEGIGTLDGKTESIDIEAVSIDAARRIMTSRGYKDVSVVEKTSFFRKTSVSNKEMSIIFRQLSAFATAGETFVRAMSNVAEVTKDETLREALLDIKRRIEMGVSIPVAFGQYKIFPSVVINLLNVADKTGEMEVVLAEISKYLEQVTDIEDGVSSATMYPKIVGGVMLIAGIGLTGYVLPQFRQFYTEMHIEMPTATKFLYALSDFLNEDWMIAIPGILALLYFLKNTKTYIPNIHDQLEVSLPIIGKIMRDLYMFRFCKTLQILTQSGTETIEALQLTRDTLENHLYTDILDKVIPLVRIGESITSSLRRNDPEGRFDIMVIAFLTTGEEAGSIPALMKSASEYYQKQLNLGIVNFGKQLEPILLVVIAIFVFALAMSIYMPIFRMSQMAGS